MKAKTLLAMFPVFGMTVGAGGCGDDDVGSGGGGGDQTTSASTTTAGPATTTAGQGGDGGGGGQNNPTAEVLASFDAAAFELPEGLAVRGEDLFVGFAFGASVDRLDLEGASRAPFSNLPVPANNTGFMTGLSAGADGDVYAALVSFTGDPIPGIYRIPAAGGAPTLFASHGSMVFPNGFAWDDGGTLFVTDSASGTVFSVDQAGTATPWWTDPLLAGDPTVCGGQAEDLAVGANGIVWTGESLLVASSDKGLVARVEVQPDGSPGEVQTIAGPDCALAGIDGIALDEDGSLLAAINRADRLVRIANDGTVTTLFEGAPLDFPASLSLVGTGDERAVYVTSFALARALAGEPASPALVRVRL